MLEPELRFSGLCGLCFTNCAVSLAPLGTIYLTPNHDVRSYTDTEVTVLNEWGKIGELSAIPGLQAQCILLLFSTPALVLAVALKEEY